MARHVLNHALSRLLRDGVIYAARTPSLFETLIDLRSDIETRLHDLGMELVLATETGVAHARNMTGEQLDAMAEEIGSEPISPVCSHQRLTYYDSVAVVHFRMSLDQELMQGGEEIWLTKADVFESLSRHYSEAISEDRISLDERIEKSLKRLEDLKLLTIRPKGPATTYRGTPLMQVAFPRDAIAEFAQDLIAVADHEAGSGGRTASGADPGDTAPAVPWRADESREPALATS